MEDDPLTSVLRIETPEQAAPFVDPKRRRILVAFMGRERALADVSRSLGIAMNLLAYHVGVFVRLGLLRIVREQKRAGRPIRFYRLVADKVIVPAEMMPGAPGDALAAEFRAALAQDRRRSGQGDLLLSVDADGRPRMRRSEADAQTDAGEYWRVLELDRRQAQQLVRDLAALLQSYESAPGPGRKTYLAHVGLAPRIVRRP